MRRREILTLAVATGPLAAPAGATDAAMERIGFALGSSALHGWAHVGIVRGCLRAGVKPYAIAGTSAGAAVGSLWAAGLQPDEIVEVVRRFGWEDTPSALPALLGVRRRNDTLRQAVDRAVGERRIEALPLRFAAVASDALTGESVVLDEGPVGLAVEASCAVPVRNEPVSIGGRQLLDGSLTSPVPVAAARQLGARRVVAVDVAYRPYEEAPSSASDYAFQAVHILTNALAREQTREVEHLIKLDIHHLMRQRLDVDALIEAGDAALTRLAPSLLQK
jgi:NTE family protein